MKTSENKIIIENVSMHFSPDNKIKGKMSAINTINLSIKKGEFFCILGPSGCGKTTLINIISGFLKPTTGRVIIDGNEVTKPNPKYVAIFQEYGLFPWRTVRDNIKFGLEMKGLSEKDQLDISNEYIELVGLQGFENHHPSELSGGMKQRVAIARTLAVNPEVIFMDEPLSALDTLMRFNLQEEITRIWQQQKKTIVLVTHNVEEAVFLSDRIAIMSPSPGKLIKCVSINLPRIRNRTSEAFWGLKGEILRIMQQYYST